MPHGIPFLAVAFLILMSIEVMIAFVVLVMLSYDLFDIYICSM